jgi:hypothetical protein
MPKKIHKNGHWESTYVPRPNKMFGFVYRITNLLTGRMYIGKKQYHMYKKRKQWKESDWRTYTSSSSSLNSDIKSDGIHNFKFEMIQDCPSRGWLVYCESNIQHKEDVLVKYFDQTDHRVYYNAQIGAIRYIPSMGHAPKLIKRQKVK